MSTSMRLSGLTAAGLCASLAVVLGGCGSQRADAHTCSAPDQQFISTAQLNMTALNDAASQYIHGQAKPGEVIGQAEKSAAIVGHTNPTDPSLSKARKYLNAMFVEYASAVQTQSKHGDARRHLYRAYGLAGFARDVLLQAQPALQPRGCDVSDLL